MQSRQVQVIGVPFDLCSPEKGSFLGPEALRHADLARIISDQGYPASYADPFPLSFSHDEPWANGEEMHVDEPRMLVPEAFMGMARAVKPAVQSALQHGKLPVILGGDHSIALASLSAALEVYGDELIVLWIDAHADINLPSTSRTGNIHGMPLAALARRPLDPPIQDKFNEHYWNQFTEELVPKGRQLIGANIAWFGLRSVDRGEDVFIKDLQGRFTATMQDIDHVGMHASVQRFEQWLNEKPNAKVWVSFDVDVLDPVLAPGTGTIVRGGLTYREGHYLAERLHEILFASGRIAGLEVMEVNPLQDHANATASVATEWVASFFGKRILSK